MIIKKHTTGRWKVNTCACFARKDGLPIATVNYLKGFPLLEEEAKANVKLIEAAPELLEDAISDLIILEDLTKNPFLSMWQKNAVKAMIHDKQNLIKKATE